MKEVVHVETQEQYDYVTEKLNYNFNSIFIVKLFQQQIYCQKKINNFKFQISKQKTIFASSN